jgi:hypothetical protein
METAMLNHVSIGVHDIAKTRRFYDASLKPLGYTCLSEGETSLGYGKDAVALWISASDRPVPADEKSGLHFCFDAPSPQGRSRHSTPVRSSAGGSRTMANQACAPTTGTELLCGLRRSIPTATGSKPIAARRRRMASIRKEMTLRADPVRVWDAVRDVGAIHTRLAPDFVTDVKLEVAPAS